MEYEKNIEASFNQAMYQQRRIDEILSRVDTVSSNPLIFYTNDGAYKILFNDLCSVFLTISAKLTEEELNEMMKLKSLIIKAMAIKPVFLKRQTKMYSGNQICLDRDNWGVLEELLTIFRLNLERLMDHHGLGNPNKDDPRYAILQG